MVLLFAKVTLMLLCIYTLIPTAVYRMTSAILLKKNQARGVALTFDDGPDPEFTPALLDTLGKYGVRATFFVLGSRARQYPELIRRIHNEGHLIGIHNYEHHSNGWMMPWKVARQIRQTADEVERITGERPQYYRPPWGVVNLFDFVMLPSYMLVHWSFHCKDWRLSTGKRKIRTRLFIKTREGAVILLHDCGHTPGADKAAPAHMIEALDEFLECTSGHRFQFVRVDEMPGLEKSLG